jgi:ATP-dependent RNA helicase MSS116
MMRELRVLVCDEADNLLDMGFKPTIVKILICLPPKEQRQALLFSATFPSDVKDLAKFALRVRTFAVSGDYIAYPFFLWVLCML